MQSSADWCWHLAYCIVNKPYFTIFCEENGARSDQLSIQLCRRRRKRLPYSTEERRRVFGLPFFGCWAWFVASATPDLLYGYLPGPSTATVLWRSLNFHPAEDRMLSCKFVIRNSSSVHAMWTRHLGLFKFDGVQMAVERSGLVANRRSVAVAGGLVYW